MNAFLHACVRFGGLGVLQLRRWIPEVRIRRMTNVLQQAKQNKDSFLMDVLHQNTVIVSEVRKFGKPQLHITVDGYGLKSFVNAGVPSIPVRMPTHQFLQCTKVRAAVLHNRLWQGEIHWPRNL